MHPIYTLISICASAIGLAAAQSIDPNSVSSGTRSQWCLAQTTQCPLICSQYPGESAATAANDCDPKTLVYNCVCAVNGLSPNVSEYSQTIPYFVCTESNNNCVAACNGNSNCQSACREDNPCGAQNPTRVNESTITTSATSTNGDAAASTASDGAVFTGFGGSDATTTPAADEGNSPTSAAALLLDLGQLYGLGVVATGIMGGFFVLL